MLRKKVQFVSTSVGVFGTKTAHTSGKGTGRGLNVALIGELLCLRVQTVLVLKKLFYFVPTLALPIKVQVNLLAKVLSLHGYIPISYITS